MNLRGQQVIAGEARGPLLRLDAPISFWGGVDAESALITQPRHPNHRDCVAGTVLALPGSIGSSSGSAILLELIRTARAPAALLMDEIDAILLVGVIVAREMGYGSIPVLRLPSASLPAHGHAHLPGDGSVTIEEE